MAEFDPADFAVTTWGKNKEFKKPFVFVTPSGQKTLLKRLDMADILKLGVVEELDFMTKALAAQEKSKAAEPTEEDEDGGTSMLKLLSKSKNFDKMESSINAVCLSGVILPKLHPVPRDENARQLGINYIDDVPFNDRMTMFGEIFDMDGIADFREEPANGVGDVPDSADVSLPTD